MRPSRIVIEGLRSFRQRVEIEFEDRQLFAIIGPTGAGKSSILEAITFALYGSSTWIGQNRPLISDTADDMLVEMTFEASGKTYVVERTASRARPSRAVLRCETDARSWDNAGPVNAEIVRLVGLDREAFLKTVILPQGRFAELLNATPSERDNVLKNIFRVDALEEVRRHAQDLRQRIQLPVSELKLQRSLLPDDPVGALRDAQEAHSLARDSAESFEKLGALVAKHSDALKEAKQNAESARAAVSRLDQDAVASLVEGLSEVRSRAAELHKSRQGRQQELKAAVGEQTSHESQLEAAVAGGPDRTELGRADAALATIIASLPEFAAELTALAREEAALQARSAEIDPLKVLVKGAKELTQAMGAQADSTRARREQTEKTRNLAMLDLTHARNASERAEEARELVEQRESDARAAQLRYQNTHAEVAEARIESAQARAELESLRLEHAAAHVAGSVQSGDLCPVCTRTLPSDFLPPEVPGLEDTEGRERTAEQRLDAALKAHAGADEAVQNSRVELESAQSTLRERRDDLESARTALADRVGSPGVSLEQNDDEILAPLREAVEVAKDLEDKSRTDFDQAVSAQREHEQSLGRLEQAIETLSSRLSERTTSIRGRATRLRESVEILPEGISGPLPIAEPPESTDPELLDASPFGELQATVAVRLSVLADIEGRIARARDAVTKARDEIELLDQREAQQVTVPLGASRNQLVQLFERLVSASEVLGATLPAIEIGADPSAETLAAAAKRARVQVSELQSASEAAATEHDRAARDAADAIAGFLEKEGVPDLDSLRREATKAAADALMAAERLRVRETDLERAQTLDEQLSSGSELVDDLEQLSNLLRDSGFIRRVLALRSQALLATAAHRLREMSGDRYAFAEGFAILDQLTGQARPARTLSGGESFLASLALALGMVDLASRAGGRLDALFLDEGFGALDANNASLAIDALEGATANGRMVAVISHVHAVADRISDVLTVVADPVGSRVAWADDATRADLVDESMAGVVAGLLTT